VISYEAELYDRVERLMQDTGPLATVSLLGFVEKDRNKARTAVDKLGEATSWSFVDLRETKPADVEGELTAGLLSRRPAKNEPLVVAIRHDRLAPPILDLVRAVIDKSSPRMSPFNSLSLLLVVDGVAAHADLHASLKRVPYEEYLP
jgi:hypothetical protein